MAKILVDTSVWIDFFRDRIKAPLGEHLSEAILRQRVAITDIIRHELLIGTQDQKSFKRMQDLLSPLECLRIAEEDLSAFDRFAWKLKQCGLQGKYTDATIAYLAQSTAYPILAFDKYFQELARQKIIKVIKY